jgi:hypothetical protein
MKYLKYLRYLAVHKWFVMLACFKRGLYWQGLVHDWSKFLPDEFFPYANFFYGEGSATRSQPTRARQAFDVAWLKHQHRNPHHYQHWILREDSGETFLLRIPEKYILEMLSDWEGAGRAITGESGGTADWYKKNRSKILLQKAVRERVERELLADEQELELAARTV